VREGKRTIAVCGSRQAEGRHIFCDLSRSQEVSKYQRLRDWLRISVIFSRAKNRIALSSGACVRHRRKPVFQVGRDFVGVLLSAAVLPGIGLGIRPRVSEAVSR